MNNLLVLPILVPFVTAIACILAWKQIRIQRILSLLGVLLLLFVSIFLVASIQRSGIQATQIGDWPAPFGITIVCDLFSAIMVTMAAIVGISAIVYSFGSIDRGRESFGYYPLMHILLMGVCGAFLTGDIFNLYVWFEVMLIASFVLLELGGEKDQLEGAVKYVTLNLISSALFLTAVAILYGISGSLNMAHISTILADGRSSGLENAVAVMLFLAFGIKAAVFPLFFWLPASYHTPPAPVSAIFAGLLTKVGVYAMIRVFTLIFIRDTFPIHAIILICSGVTMLSGVLGAMAQNEFRRILSFHIVSQVGYMIMGLGLYTPLALAGSVFYLMHHIIAKTNLFLISGVVSRLKGTYELKELGGIFKSYPLISFLFMVSASALAGIPPLSGFWAKFTLIKAGFLINRFSIVAVALVVSLLTLYSMTKIWNEVFWKKILKDNDGADLPAAMIRTGDYAFMLSPVIFLAGLNIAIGLSANFFFNLSRSTAAQLMDSTIYIRVVLGGGAP